MLVGMSRDAHTQQKVFVEIRTHVDMRFLSETLDSTHQVDRSSGRAALSWRGLKRELRGMSGRSSYKGRMVDALASRGEEGRDYLRYARGSWT